MGTSILIMAGMIICATSIVPFIWKVDGTAWAVILPLSWVLAFSPLCILLTRALFC